MNISVEMTAEEFEAYREYQKEKSSLEAAAYANYYKLREWHEKLCKAVLDGIEQTDAGTLYANNDPTIKAEEKAEIKDMAAVLRAVEIARDWYA